MSSDRLAQILANEELRQALFPVARESVFLAHAAVAPLPQPVVDAIQQYAVQSTREDQETSVFEGLLGRLRQRVAQLIGAGPNEIALVGPTSLALSYVAAGLPLNAGDDVLMYAEDYPSNVYPWQALQEKGVQVRSLQPRTLGFIRPEDVLDQLRPQTRLVALASCHFLTGHRLDLAHLGPALRERGVWFCVDAIQTLGAFPTAAAHVDILAADAHKWLLGPCAAGVLFVRREVQEFCRPVVWGWHNVWSPDFIAQPTLRFRGDARRYEAGTHNLLGLVGLDAALGLLLELEVESIALELCRKRRWLLPELARRGYVVLNREAEDRHVSGIVTFHRPGKDARVLHAHLTKAGMVTSLRCDRAGTRYVRLSPHAYNTDAELRRLLECLDRG